MKGKYFKEWITFRSQIISDFTGRVRNLVDLYKNKKNPNLKMAAYVGSWYGGLLSEWSELGQSFFLV